MNKWMAGILVLAISTTMAAAGAGVNWMTLWAGYDHTATDLSGYDNALLDSYAVTWQLIYAGTNNAINDPDLSNSANGWVGGDDDVWATRTISQGGGIAPEDGTQWDNWMTWNNGSLLYENPAWNTAGYIFQRVYEGAPAELSWYFDSPLTAINTSYTGGGMPPQDLTIDSPLSGFQPDQQIPKAPVPEPATMGLLGLGSLALALRQRRS